MNRLRANVLLAPALLLSGFFGTADEAQAWSFYWSKVEVQTSSWSSCMSMAHAVAARRNLTQLRRDNLAVSGSVNGASATITCIGTGGNSKAMAVVMVVGDVDGPVRQLRDQLVTAVTRERIID